MATEVNEFVELLASNSTATAFAANAPTVTEPTGAGIVDLARAAGRVHNNVLLVPFGAGSANDTFDVRVSGWSKVGTLWVPVVLAEFECTLGATTGVAATAVLDTELFCDTIALDTAYSALAGVSASVVSPANDTVCHALLDLKGFSKVEIEFDRTAGATACNCLYRLL